MIEIGTAISSLAALKTIFEGAIATRDESKLTEVKLAFQQQMIEVQGAMLAMQHALAQAHQKELDIADAQRRELKFEQETLGYETFEVAPGVFAYALATSDGTRPKQPYYCHPCYKARKQSILSYEAALSNSHPAALRCPEQASHRMELPKHWRREHVANGMAGGVAT